MTTLIFDCDGVLVDSEVIAHRTLHEMLIALGLDMTMEEALRTFAGRSLKDTIGLIKQRLGHAMPASIGDQYRELLFARFRAELNPVAGVADAINALLYPRCAASSSSPDRLHLALEVTSLAPLFANCIYSATQVARGKPAPDLFLFAAEQMGAEPRHCIVIEDSPLGIEAGIAAGMRTIGFAGASHATDELVKRLGAAGARKVIRDMRELPPCVEALKVRE